MREEESWGEWMRRVSAEVAKAREGLLPSNRPSVTRPGRTGRPSSNRNEGMKLAIVDDDQQWSSATRSIEAQEEQTQGEAAATW